MSYQRESQPGLRHLPVELVERVVENLDLLSIKNLRLTCKVLRDKSVGPWLKEHVTRQHTDLSKGSLERLQDLAQNATFGKMVKKLTIVAAVYDMSVVKKMLETKTKTVHERRGVFQQTSYPACTEQELADAKADLEWLEARDAERAQIGWEVPADNLATALRSFGTLESIDLVAHVVQGRNTVRSPGQTREWVLLWTEAARVYNITMTAISLSLVSTEFLNIYRLTPACSVASFEVTTQLNQLDVDAFAKAGKHIKNFALNMATRVPIDAIAVRNAAAELQDHERISHEMFGSSAGLFKSDSAEAQDEDNFTGVPRLLQLMPNLEALDLHMRNCLKDSFASLYSKIFVGIARAVHLPSLHQIILRGVSMTKESLTQFLVNHPKLDEVYLQHIFLTEGDWTPIFEVLSKMPNLKLLHLSNLWDTRLVNLNPIDESMGLSDDLWSRSYPCFDGTLVHTNRFTQVDLKKGLRFQPAPSQRPLGSPQLYNWRQRSLEFRAPGSI
jgi:hypothetical protein